LFQDRQREDIDNRPYRPKARAIWLALGNSMPKSLQDIGRRRGGRKTRWNGPA